MKLLLVNPPNGLHDRSYLAPPLGLLTLAAVVQARGHEASLLDFNLEVLADPARGSDGFYEFARGLIATEGADAVGFTSMCVESHVALELARLVKLDSPRTTTVFGGTHFGAIARELLEHFPAVDYVVSGEGEEATATLLDRLASAGGGLLPGNVWRRVGGEVVAGGGGLRAPLLEELPFPAYDLVDLERYFALNPAHLLNYEAGRGCVFKCAFCYSPFQYGDAVRDKPPAVVVEDMRRLSRLGARHLFFVQDNLLNSPRWAIEVCRHIAVADLPLTWECYATYPQLKDHIVDALAAAGCVGVFTGVDAVTDESQVRLNKRFLKNREAAKRKVARCRASGVLPVCAFILEGPDQPPAKVDETVRMAIECLDAGAEIDINTLSLYNNTALASGGPPAPLSYTPIKPELMLDTPPVVRENELAQQFPQLFPYHATHFDVAEWEIFSAKAYMLWAALHALRRTLRRHVVEEGNPAWGALDYVDGEEVRALRRSPDDGRRFGALMRFASHFHSLPLTPATRASFRRELAQTILSSLDASRPVSVSFGDGVMDYSLGWFLYLTEGGQDSGLSDRLVLDSYLGAPGRPDTSEGRYELALRSRHDTVRFYVLDEGRLGLLSKLSRASESGRPLTLSRETARQLEHEGWLWRAG